MQAHCLLSARTLLYLFRATRIVQLETSLLDQRQIVFLMPYPQPVSRHTPHIQGTPLL